MSQTKIGALKILAKKARISLSGFQKRVSKGLKWCYKCGWWKIAKSDFQIDRSRYDGRSPLCNTCRSIAQGRRYVPRPRQSKKGARFVPVRDGDKLQARARVNHLVLIGLFPKPDSLACTDCGDVNNKHTYDHYLGYSAEHQEDVEPTCYKCHAQRTRRRGEHRSFHKVNVADVEQIRILYARGQVSQFDLGKRFGISEGAVYSIIKGNSWKHVGGPLSKQENRYRRYN